MHDYIKRKKMRGGRWKWFVGGVCEIDRKIRRGLPCNEQSSLKHYVCIGNCEHEQKSAIADVVFCIYRSSRESSIETRVFDAVSESTLQSKRGMKYLGTSTSAPMENSMSSLVFERAKRDAATMKEDTAIVKAFIWCSRFSREVFI